MNSLTKNRILGFLIVSTILLATTSFIFSSLTLSIFSLISLLLLSVAVRDTIQTKHSLLRNFPLLGRLRWVFEHERSKIQQYFIEDDTNGTPYNRESRSDVYQKSKGDLNTTPFGTKSDVYEKGYEFIKHSMYPKNINDVKDPRVVIV